ncbi:hypothetical protein Taro_049062, partial [Colocasia esculenta]|nr:hypothetical protein [Colocasia esculenta]
VVKSKRSFWRLSTITHFFWAIVNFIGVFFITMFSVCARIHVSPSILFSISSVDQRKGQMNTRTHQAQERNGMVVREEVPEGAQAEDHMVVPVDPVEWRISVQMITMPFLPAGHAAEVKTPDNRIVARGLEILIFLLLCLKVSCSACA